MFHYFTNLVTKGLSLVLQSLITKGLGKQEIPLKTEDQNIIIRGLSLIQQKLAVKGFSGGTVVVQEFNNIVTKGLSLIQHNLITKGLDVGQEAPVPPITRRHGGTVVGISVGLSVGMIGSKEFEESLQYECVAEIHKEVLSECLVFGSKQLENQITTILKGDKEFVIKSLTSIIAKTQHLNEQVLKIQGKKLFNYNETKSLKASKIFNSNLENRINASRQFNSELQNLVKASRIQKSNLVTAAKGKRDLFPILFAAVDMYNEIFTDELEV